MLRALRHRNFRLFFFGQSVSLIGTWMQQVAMSWVVYLLTRQEDSAHQDVSAYWLGLVNFAGQIPAFFLAPVAGVLIDRWNRHRLIILTQTLAMLQAFALAVMSLHDPSVLPWILVLSVVLGLINAFDMPARQAFLTEMLDHREDLGNAIALNSSMFNGARLIGPALAATLLALLGPRVCFIGNGISYLAVIAALLAMRVTARPPQSGHKHLFKGLREGFAYAFGFAPIRNLLLLIAVVSLASMAYSILLPLIATQVLHGDSWTYGFLTIASGLGALSGAIYLASRRSVLGLGRWIRAMPALLGMALLAFSFSEMLWLSLMMLALAGFATMVTMGACNTVVQTIVEEDKRGRVMSLYTMAFMGMAPLGSLLGGFLASHYGPDNAIRASGAICLVGAVVFTVRFQRVRELIRPIYKNMGILPEMPSGVYPAVSPPSPMNGERPQ